MWIPQLLTSLTRPEANRVRPILRQLAEVSRGHRRRQSFTAAAARLRQGTPQCPLPPAQDAFTNIIAATTTTGSSSNDQESRRHYSGHHPPPAAAPARSTRSNTREFVSLYGHVCANLPHFAMLPQQCCIAITCTQTATALNCPHSLMHKPTCDPPFTPPPRRCTRSPYTTACVPLC